MVVLALETATPQGSLALWRDGTCVSRVGDASIPHAMRMPHSWLAILDDAGLSLDDVDGLAVVSGPGSFTGLRIGMASAQGLALTRNWSVTPVPTLDAIAECWRASHDSSAPRLVVACLDGLRGEVFAREFRFDGAQMIAQAEPVVTPPASLTWTPFGTGVSIVGNGAVKHAEALRHKADDIADVSEPIAAGAARLAARGHFTQVSPHALRPLYVRRPDVEIARERGRPRVC